MASEAIEMEQLEIIFTMASEAIEMEQLEIVPVTHESQSKLQKIVSDDDSSEFRKLKISGGVNIEQLISKEKPSFMIEAFEKRHYSIMYELSHCFCEMLKKAALSHKQSEIDLIVCHLMSETKYEADRLRVSGEDDNFDYILEIFYKVHKHNEKAIEDALAKAATASEEADGQSKSTSVKEEKEAMKFDYKTGYEIDGCSTKNEWPLLIAAGCGFKDCVKTILEKEKDRDLIMKTDLYGHNFLMRAIKGKHRDVVRTVLNIDDNAIVDLMKVSINWRGGLLGATYETPLRWLIKTMPDMAKQFLELCVTEEKKGQQETTYNYDFIDDFKWVKEGQNSEYYKEGSICTKIKKTLMSKCQKPSNHVLTLMIKHDKLKLLKHPLVTRWIEQKWKRIKITYVTYCALYSVLLAILTAYAVTSPITALDSSCSNLSLAQIQNQNNSNSSSMTISTSCLMNHPYLFVGGILVIVLSILHIAIELQQIFQRGFDYFLDWERYLQLFVFSGAIASTSNFGYNCHCKTPSQWHLEALIIFCAWFNYIVLLKKSPTFGAPIHLLFRICYKYITLIYLPILLVISFALPFHMLFVKGTSSIKGFNTSRWSLLTTFAATSGGLGYGDIFLNGPLPYFPASIVLFMIFVVIVSILFNNMLVGLAVGDASNAIKEADLLSLASQVEYIILAEDALPCIKIRLLKEKVNSEQQNPSCCSWFSITKIYLRLTKSYQRFFPKDSNENYNDEIEKKDILSVEDKVMEQLKLLREDIEKRDASMKEELRKILSLFENIPQKAGPYGIT